MLRALKSQNLCPSQKLKNEKEGEKGKVKGVA
jgi:hypothetical protein